MALNDVEGRRRAWFEVLREKNRRWCSQCLLRGMDAGRTECIAELRTTWTRRWIRLAVTDSRNVIWSWVLRTLTALWTNPNTICTAAELKKKKKRSGSFTVFDHVRESLYHAFRKTDICRDIRFRLGVRICSSVWNQLHGAEPSLRSLPFLN